MKIIRYAAAAAAVIGLAGCGTFRMDSTGEASKFDGHYVGYFDAKDCPGATGQSTRIDAYIDNGLMIAKAGEVLLNAEVSDEGNFVGTALVDKDDLSNAWMFNWQSFRLQGKVGDGVIQANAKFGARGSQTACPEDGPAMVELKKE